MEIIKETCYKGTQILLGNKKRRVINKIISSLIKLDFQEIHIPVIQNREYFLNKVGVENNNLMYNFKDRGGREVCLAPEYTSVIQMLGKTRFKHRKDVKVFYVSECFRGEKPQKGRYRQFTQLGVEIINPSNFVDAEQGITTLASLLMGTMLDDNEYEVHYDVSRGLDYYRGKKGFEITAKSLGAASQIVGGGVYDNGVGFAIGIDRLLLLLK